MDSKHVQYVSECGSLQSRTTLFLSLGGSSSSSGEGAEGALVVGRDLLADFAGAVPGGESID